MNAALLADLWVGTLRDPRGVARWLLGLNLPMSTRWLALLAVAAVGAILVSLTGFVAPAGTPSDARLLLEAPMPGFAFQILSTLVLSLTMAMTGRWFGSAVPFADAMLLATWIEAMTLPPTLLEVVLMLIAAPAVFIVAVATLIGFFYVLVNMTAELHRSPGAGKVALAGLATLFVFSLILAILMMVLGIDPPMGAA
jgi:hypothetical protein